ncbi:MAG: hypothetical protein IPM77_07285 [Crocinitomicaceae bacterium]|nr:hypothetical protein [Crocinitomicaceae bacterium]
MILGALFGFIHALKIKGFYSRVLNWSMVVAVGATFTQIPIVVQDAYYLFALTQLGVIIYGISGSDFSAEKKSVVAGSGVLSLIPVLLFFNLSEFYLEIAALCGVVQIILFAYAIKKDVQAYKEEMGFLVILAADALTRVLSFLMFLFLA